MCSLSAPWLDSRPRPEARIPARPDSASGSHLPARAKDERAGGSARLSSGTRRGSEHAARAAVGPVGWSHWCDVRDWLSADCGLCRRRKLVVIVYPLPAFLCKPPTADLRLFPGKRAARGGIVSDRCLMDGTNGALSAH